MVGGARGIEENIVSGLLFVFSSLAAFFLFTEHNTPVRRRTNHNRTTRELTNKHTLKRAPTENQNLTGAQKPPGAPSPESLAAFKHLFRGHLAAASDARG